MIPPRRNLRLKEPGWHILASAAFVEHAFAQRRSSYRHHAGAGTISREMRAAAGTISLEMRAAAGTISLEVSVPRRIHFYFADA